MDEEGGDAACWAAQFDEPMTTRVTVRGIAAAADAIGRCVLVDAVAPAARDDYDLWLPEIAPSLALMRRFDGRPERWGQFCADYARELGEAHRVAALATLERLARQGALTLLTAASDPSRSAAEALRGILTERLRVSAW